MNESPIEVEIICPKCTQKAIFHTVLVGSYKLYPNKQGNASCLSCGYNSSDTLSNSDYFYQINIENRTLYARSMQNLIVIRDYFENYPQNKNHSDPDLDFPKLFYKHKEEIVKKINDVVGEQK